MSNKHTPGPWVVSKSGAAVDMPCGIQVRLVTLHGATGIGFNPLADAALIAAAPDLLEACEQAERCFVSLFGEDANHRAPALDSLRAAIKKARGE